MRKEWQGHVGKILDSIDKYDVILCEACQFIHKIPLPKQDEWHSFYFGSFYNCEDKDDYLEETEKDKIYRDILHEDKYLNLLLLIGKLDSSNNKSHEILDIGSGGGFFTEYFNKKGWSAIGVEPSKKAFDYAIKKTDLR